MSKKLILLFCLINLILSCGKWNCLIEISDEPNINENNPINEEPENHIIDTLEASRLKKFTVIYDSPTQVTLQWDQVDNSIPNSGYRISYIEGNIAPIDCSSPNISNTDISGKSHTISGLLSDTEYSFRICAERENNISEGIIKTIKTVSECDFTVSPGSLDAGNVEGISFANIVDGIDHRIEFNNFLIAAEAAGDQGIDGKITICLEDGITIINNSDGFIEISSNNMVLFASSSASVIIDDQRIGDISGGNDVVIRFSGLAQEVYNLSIQSSNNDAIGLVALENINIVTGIIFNTGDNSQGAVVANVGSIQELHNIDIKHRGNYGAIYMWSGNIPKISVINIELLDVSGEYAIYSRFGFNSRIDIQDVSIVNNSLIGAGASIGLEGNLNSVLKNIDVINNVTGKGISLLNSDLSILENIKIITKESNSPGISLYYSNVEIMNDVIIQTEGGILSAPSPAIYLQTNSSILNLTNSIFKRNASLGKESPAILFDDGDNSYVDTLNVKDNIVCTMSSSDSNWTQLVGNNMGGGVINNITNFTTAYNSGSNTGSLTFPWGDDNDTSNAPYNLQTQWGGICP